MSNQDNSNPKVFISYSWSSPGHRARILEWAERLIADGIDVVFDNWDLNEGDDKYAFMERMVNDPSVTHVLIFSDAEYAEKADGRRGGVGTESQIISKEVYEQVNQSKFIPLVCETDASGEPCLPTFLKNRIWIDFSHPEAANENWERLVRVVYGKPMQVKPRLGKPPVYLDEPAVPSSPAAGRFAALKQALFEGKVGRKRYREDFIDACYEYADALRVRARPDIEDLGNKVLEDCGKLKLVRDHLVDWILIESELDASQEFVEALLETLERLIALKSWPPGISTWNEAWSEAHRVFVYETFLYLVAALIKAGADHALHTVFTSNYLVPSPHGGESRFTTFRVFWASSDALQILAPKGKRLLAPAAELVKRQADRADLPFEDLKQAELLVLLVAFASKNMWYPQTLLYCGMGETFRLFVRATQHRGFERLRVITGINDAEMLREKVREGHESLGASRWTDFWDDRTFWKQMNMDQLDTLD